MSISKQDLLAGFDDVWESLVALGESLTDDEWEAQTRCPGWSVRDNFSHMIGTERMLMGDPNPEVDLPELDHVKNDIGKINEAWVQERRSRSGADVLAEFKETIARRRPMLVAMTQEHLDAEGWTPAGMDTNGRFMRIRVFDHWIHGQDIREAIDRPGDVSGPAVELSLDEISSTMGYVVGKKAGTPDGSSVAFVVEGEPTRRIDVVVDGRASLVETPVAEPTVKLTMPLRAFAAIAGGREGSERFVPEVEISGDEELGRRVLQNMAVMI